MSRIRKLGRRQFLLGLAATGGAILAGCTSRVTEKGAMETEVAEETVEASPTPPETVQQPTAPLPTAPPTAEPAAQSTLELRVSRLPATWADAVHEQFELEHPDITLQVETLPNGEYWRTLRKEYTGGRLSDTFWTWQENGEYNRSAATGMISSVTPYVEAADFDTSAYYENVLSVYTKDTELMLIPEFAHPGPVGIFINKSMCDQAGLTYAPTPDADIHADWTLEDFLGVMRKLTITDDAGKVVRYGYSRSSSYPQLVSSLRRFGGNVLAESGRDQTIDSEASIAGIQFVSDLIHEHKVCLVPDTGADFGHGLFATGDQLASHCDDVAMAIGLDKFLQGGFDCIGVTLPRHAELGHRGLLLSSGGNCISTQSTNPQAAYEYCQFMGSHDVGTQRALLGGASPGGRPDCWNDERIQAHHSIIPMLAALIPEARPDTLPWNGHVTRLQEEVSGIIHKVWLGEMTAEEGCAEAAVTAKFTVGQRRLYRPQ